MIKETVITLVEGDVTIATTDENNIKNVKHTNLQNLQQAFLSEQSFESPLLPSQWGVVKYYKKNQYEGFVVTTPPTTRQIKFNGNYDLPIERDEDGNAIGELPIPPMLWLYEVCNQDGRSFLTHSMAFALKHELLSLNDRVFHAPFPNIGIDHGICWGSENPRVPTSKSIQNIPANFFHQYFNRDLSENRLMPFPFSYEGQREFQTTCAHHHMALMINKYKEVENNTDFKYPIEMLRAYGNNGNNTVEEVIRRWMPAVARY